MSKITLIVGLPGSGKSFLADILSVKCNGIVIDDIQSLDELPEHGENIIITDVNFCCSNILNMASKQLLKRYPGYVLNVIHFENDEQACRANVARRDDGRKVEGTIKRFETIYDPPITAKPVYKEK